MKICPQCESGFHDSYSTCPTHGGLLSEIRDLRPGMLIRDTYRIVRKLGKGGMGAVYLAQHTLLDEPRALKFLSQDLSEDENFTSRFLREVRTLRRVRNRNVVDCGDPERAEDGSLFFSMEYVDGPNLRDYFKTAPSPFDVGQALEIARGIALGLGAAHAKGMVHRDIKPENILLAREGEHWIPKIADFGIVATKESSQQTRTGSTLLTMAYAAPEQWLGTRAAELDGRADLYALGGVLFELLTGRAAFEAENYQGWAQMHLNAAPPRPSSLRPELAQWPGLDELVLRLLAKDPGRRPQHVADFLHQLSAIEFDPALPLPRAGGLKAAAVRPARREASAAPPHADSAGGLPGREAEDSAPTPAFTPDGLRRAAEETSLPWPVSRQEARTSQSPGIARPAPPPPIPFPRTPAREDRTQTTFSAGTAEADLRPGHAPGKRRPSQPDAPDTVAAQRDEQTIVDPRSSGSHRTFVRTSRGAAAKPAESAAEKKGAPIWLWIAFLVLIAGAVYGAERFYKQKPSFVALQSQNGPVVSIAYSPDGLTLASASQDNTIQFWDISASKAQITLPDRANAIAFSPDGHYIASADADKNVRLWDTATGAVVATLGGHADAVLSVAFSPDGRLLASGSRDKTVRLWDVAGDRVLRTLQGHAGDVNAVAFSPDARTLASAGADAAIRLWDPASGKLLRTLQGHSRAINAVAFSPDRRTLASASDDTTLMVWSVEEGKNLSTLHGHTGAVHAVAYSSDGHSIASGSSDKSVRLWDATSGQPAGVLRGHASPVLSVAFGPQNTLASGSEDRTIRVWDLTGVHN